MVGARWTALLAPVVALAGCASELVDEPPEDPAASPYLYRADGEHKAPHHLTGTVEFTWLSTIAAGFDVPVASVLVEEAPVLERPPAADGEDLSTSRLLPAELVIERARGLVTTPQGDEVPLPGGAVTVVGDEPWEMHGLGWVRAGDLTFTEGRAHARAVGLPIRGQGADEILVGVRVGIASGGSSTSEVDVYRAHTDELIARGTLVLDEGGYDISAGKVSFLPAEPMRGRADGTINIRGASVATLNGDTSVEWPAWRAIAVGGDLVVDVGVSEVELNVRAEQLYAEDRPQFEGALSAQFEEGGTEAEVQIGPGGNHTLWVRVSETSGVGSVPNARPFLEDGGLEATYAYDWYASPEPHLLVEFGKAVKQGIFGAFVDFTQTYFRPLETQYIPLYVEAPDGTAAGTYTVIGHVRGDNARSNEVTLTVTVA